VIFNATLFASALLVATPLILAAGGGAISHQAGVFNFTLDGLMLWGAFFAIYFAKVGGSWGVGLVGAAAMTIVASLAFGFVVIRLKANPIVAALGLNLVAAGVTSLLLRTRLSSGGGAVSAARLPDATPRFLARLPVVGHVLAGQSILVYLAIVSGPCIYFFLTRSAVGLRLRAAGDAPESAAIAGISVARMRYLALALTGLLCGLAGAQLSMGIAQFTENITAGRGITAFAAVIFGRNLPYPVFATAAFFGFSIALTDRLQGLGLPGELVVLIPYFLTVVALAVSSRRTIAAYRQALA
jgi:simple sugar transport system permease protein